MATIDDGKGSGRKMSVSSTQRGNVSAKTAPRLFYSSRDDGLGYNAVYDDMTVAAGEVCAYLKNTSSTRNLFIKEIDLHSAEAVKWKIFSVSGTAASGTAITPTELNLSKGISAEASAMSGDTAITGLTNIAQVGTHRTPALDQRLKEYEGSLILGPGDAIACEYDTGTTGLCSAEILFWFEDIGAS